MKSDCWLENNRKELESQSDAVASPMAIVATTVIMGGLKIKISIKISYLGGWIGWRWITSVRK